MNRRAFVAALATLITWPPLSRLRAHDNTTRYNSVPRRQLRDRTLLRLWDGTTLVDELWVSNRRPHRRLFALVDSIDNRVWYTPSVAGNQHRPTWLLSGGVVWEVEGQTVVFHDYQYLSGPKWWRLGNRPAVRVYRHGDRGDDAPWKGRVVP